MRAREIDLRLYRVVARFSILFSLALVVMGLYAFVNAFQQRQTVGVWDTLLIAAGVMAILLGVLALWPTHYFRVRPDAEAATLLVLLTRKDCLLCLEAREVLREATKGTSLRVQEVDIDEHRSLRRRFKNHIPVVLWQGDELARLRVDPDQIRVAIRAIENRRSNA